MAQDNVFGHLIGANRPQAPQPQPQQDPVIARDPYKAEDQQFQRNAEARALQDQVDQAERLRMERQRLEMARADQARQEAEFSGKGGKPTEAENKTSTLLTRIMGGVRDIQATAKNDPDAQRPGLIENMRGDLMPGGWTGAPARAIAGEDRRIIHDAQRDVLDALLTLSTGAAYTPEQLTGQMASHFPQYGDTQNEIDIKNQRLKRLIEGAKVAAGPRWSEIEQAIAPYMQSLDAKVPEGSTVKDGKIYGPDGKYLGVSPGAPDGPLLPPGGGDGGGGFFGVNSLEEAGRGLAMGVGDIVESVGDTAGIVVNPVATMLGRSLGYDGYTADFGKDVREALNLPDNPNQVASAINKGGVAALTGSLGARGLSSVVNSPAGRNALLQFGATPGRDMLAGAGAGAGGEIGREVGGLPGQVVGTLAGGVGGYAGGNALLRNATPRTPNALMQSADDLNVTMLPADVGGTGTRMASGAVNLTLGGIPMAKAAEGSITSAASARSKVASSVGDVADNVGAGQATKRGFKQFGQSSEKRAEELYDRVSVPAQSEVQLGNTRKALEEVTRGMQSNPELSRLWANHPRLRATLETLTPKDVAPEGRASFTEASGRLTQLLRTKEAEIGSVPGPHRTANLDEQIAKARADVAAAKDMSEQAPQGGKLSWEDMKRFRSIVGEIIGQPGIKRDGSDIAALRKLYGALTSDMEVTAAQTGPKALQEFRRANQYWRGRESRIDEVFSALLGKDGQRSDEAVFKQINTWAQSQGGDFGRLARTIRSLPEDEANTVRATLIQRMGMARPANQDATGEVFSPALFATEWRGLSSRAKSVLFPNQQHRQDLEKLAALTGEMKAADKYRNYSNTSLGVNATAQGSLALTNLPVAVALAGLQFGAGKLLASPKVARILASSSKMPAEQAGRKISEQLKVIATREPAIAADAKALQQFLAEQLGKSPGRAAAEDSSDRRREPPK